MHAISIDRSGPHTRKIAVPDFVGVFRKLEPLEFALAVGVEKAKLHLVACAENRAKFTPRPSQVAPSGNGMPSVILVFSIE